jgi:hypothetical protein
MQQSTQIITSINNISIYNPSWLWWYRGRADKAPKTSKTGTNTMVNMIQKYAGREGKQSVTH